MEKTHGLQHDRDRAPGHTGSAVGKILGQNGYEVITRLNGRGDFTRNKANESGMGDAGTIDDLTAKADLVLSILDPGKAVMVAEEIAQAMRNTGRTPVYADCNATSPQTATELQGNIEGAGGVFVDVGTEIGQGSAIKICNGAWNKGAFALYTAVMTTAEHYGFTEHLRQRLPGSQAGTVEKIDQAMTRLPTLPGRYIGEMEQIAETFAAIGLPTGFHDDDDMFRLLNRTPVASQRRGEIDRDRTPLEILKIIVDTLHGVDTPRGKE